METEIGFRGCPGKTIHESLLLMLREVSISPGRWVSSPAAPCILTWHSYCWGSISFWFLLIFPVPSVSNCLELITFLSLLGLSSHVPVASMTGSCLIPNCFSLGSIQQQSLTNSKVSFWEMWNSRPKFQSQRCLIPYALIASTFSPSLPHTLSFGLFWVPLFIFESCLSWHRRVPKISSAERIYQHHKLIPGTVERKKWRLIWLWTVWDKYRTLPAL